MQLNYNGLQNFKMPVMKFKSLIYQEQIIKNFKMFKIDLSLLFPLLRL